MGLPARPFEWEWAKEPKAYSWKRGDYIYIPPFTNHQHVAGDHDECRLIVMSNRITKEMGFDWFDQVAKAAAGYDPPQDEKRRHKVCRDLSPSFHRDRGEVQPEASALLVTPVPMVPMLRSMDSWLARSARPGMTPCQTSILHVSRRASRPASRPNTADDISRSLPDN